MTDPAALAAWLRQQLDEDERLARALPPGPWLWAKVEDDLEYEGLFGADGDHILSSNDAEGYKSWIDKHPALNAYLPLLDPARVLRAVEAKRRILAAYSNALTARKHAVGDIGHLMEGAVNTLEHVLRMLAAEYAHRPGYREEEWKP